MSQVKIEIEGYCDGFAVIIDGERFYFDQEGTVEELATAFERVAEDCEITYEEVY